MGGSKLQKTTGSNPPRGFVVARMIHLRRKGEEKIKGKVRKTQPYIPLFCRLVGKRGGLAFAVGPEGREP